MGFLRKTLFAMIGQSIPSRLALLELLGDIKSTIIYAVVSAVMLSATVLTLLFGLYNFVLLNLMSQAASFGVICAILIVITYSMILLSRRASIALMTKRESITPTTEKTIKATGEVVESAISAFITGFSSAQKKTPTNFEDESIEIKLVRENDLTS